LLNDPSAGVRRTAGDALSDIGDSSAESAVCQALSDGNKLVRWRAARFLCDTGTEAALPYLENAAQDAEFEVHLEVEAAIQRIRGGGEGLGPAWKRIMDGA
jgi:HEAT repeat protein